MSGDGWRLVIHAMDCTPSDDDEDTLICPVCNSDYGECACPGPHQDDLYDYKEVDGRLHAKLRSNDTVDL